MNSEFHIKQVLLVLVRYWSVITMSNVDSHVGRTSLPDYWPKLGTQEFGHFSLRFDYFVVCVFNPLKTKRRLLYLKTQFVPLSKHF